MQKQHLHIAGIPAILWGPASHKLFIAIHGDHSYKEDTPVVILANEAMKRGCQTLSFDLPEHGDRQHELYPCTVQNCLTDLAKIEHEACHIANNISIFGCSIGAYFSLLAFQETPIQQALFLSPVVDMKRIIVNMMTMFGISEERLQQEQKIVTPVKTLDWDDYQYVVKHSVQWHKPTALLYGKKDTLCELDTIQIFVKNTHADLTIYDDGEHHFHTDTQLTFFQQWLTNKIGA